MEPWRAEVLCRALAEAVKHEVGEDRVEMVISPALGGVVVGYEVARQLGIASLFAERVDGVFTLRRGFDIPEGTRVLMAEDVVTTGKSSRECIACIHDNGGRVVAASCLIDRSGGEVDLGVPLVALASLSVPNYAPDALPPDLAAVPAVKPGSRGLA
jgi:orotate phosphoribosyltransferase